MLEVMPLLRCVIGRGYSASPSMTPNRPHLRFNNRIND
jgi:hypothetical protein